MAEAARVEAAVPEAFPRVVPGAEPGRVLGLVGPPGSGLTRLGLSLLADPARRGLVGSRSSLRRARSPGPRPLPRRALPIEHMFD